MRRVLNRGVVLISQQSQPRRQFHNSRVYFERFTEIVPALGESITEGSIASWAKNIGEKVEVDDVVAIVETDKVTVDLKATRAGILVKTFAEDGNVSMSFVIRHST